jgi:hypothetical protein
MRAMFRLVVPDAEIACAPLPLEEGLHENSTFGHWYAYPIY